MMKKTILAALLVSPIFAFASPCDIMVPYGYPTVPETNTTQLCRLAYTVKHDNVRKVPVYSAEWLIETNATATARINAFKADPDLQPGERAELTDYNKAYDRGHMTPFEDAAKNSAGALQTFYLSNMIPQNLHLNRGLWHAIENHVRKFSQQSKNGVYVITGPVFDTTPYTTIGNGVGVPTRVFKVVIDKETQQGVAFLVPNTDPAKGIKFDSYEVPIAEVEKVTGINFTPSCINCNGALKSVIGAEFQTVSK